MANTGRGSDDARSVESVLSDCAAEVARHGAGDPQFVTVGIDVPARAVDVWRTGRPSDEADASYRDLVPVDVVVRLRRAVLSREQSFALDALVDAKAAELHARGLDLVVWGMLDGWEHAYVIGYEGPPTPPEDLAEAFAVFGPGTVELRREDRPDGGVSVGTIKDRQT